MSALHSYPASVTQLVGQVDAGEEIRSNACQGLYFSLDLSLLHQFHLQQEQTRRFTGQARGNRANKHKSSASQTEWLFCVLGTRELRVLSHTFLCSVSHKQMLELCKLPAGTVFFFWKWSRKLYTNFSSTRSKGECGRGGLGKVNNHSIILFSTVTL